MEDRYKFPLGITLPLTPEKIKRFLLAFSIPRRFPGDREWMMILGDQQATFEDLDRARAMYDRAFSSNGKKIR